MIEFNVVGLEKVTRALGHLGSIKPYQDGMHGVAVTAFELAKRYAPELTGRMMQQILYGMNSPTEYFIRCDVPYAVYNEYGTIHMPAGTPDSPLGVISGSGKFAFRPFIRPALIQAGNMAPKIMKEELFHY